MPGLDFFEGRAAAICAVLALAGCGGSEAVAPTTHGTGSTLENLLMFGTPDPGPAPVRAGPVTEVDCPEIEVLDGTSSLRVTSGGDANSNVRHQFSLGETARECRVEGNQLVMKVGAEGRVLIGPAGAPGAFNVPVRIVVRHDADEKIVSSQIYRVPVSVPEGQTEAPFSVVSNEISVPFPGKRASQAYTIIVGFDGTGEKAPPVARVRRRHARG
jgi:hypothetical protein